MAVGGNHTRVTGTRPPAPACQLESSGTAHRSANNRGKTNFSRCNRVVEKKSAHPEVPIASHKAAAPDRMHPRVSLEKIEDRKSTRLNSSHLGISYAVF